MIIKNKKGFLLRDFVLASLLFSLVVFLFIAMTGSIADNYDNTDMVSDSFATHYNNLQSQKNQLDISYKAVQGGKGGLDLIGAFNIAFNSVFTVVAMVWDTITMYGGMAVNISEDFTFLNKNIIYTVLSAIIAMLVAYLMFVWLSSVSRGKI